MDAHDGALDVGESNTLIRMRAVLADKPLCSDHLLALGEELARRRGCR